MIGKRVTIYYMFAINDLAALPTNVYIFAGTIDLHLIIIQEAHIHRVTENTPSLFQEY